MKLLSIFFLIMLAAAIALSQPPGSGKKNAPTATLSAIDVLAEGSNGKIEKPFIFVARDKETYAALQKIVENLPDKVDFSKNAVVAAFLGTKPTGGYGIGISADILNDPYTGAKLSITAVNPAPGRPVTDALTSPFQVVLIPVATDKTLKVETAAEWKNAAEVYKVVSGTIEVRGGINYPYKTFRVSGTVSVWRNAEMITCAFNLSGKSAGKQAALEGTTSGSVDQDGLLKLSRLDAGSFFKKPSNPFKVEGKLGMEKLSLEFAPGTSSSPRIRENSEGRGRVEFVKQK